mmetsp:Transcript_29361/g.77124  ORF Transcript_29361/g.77124 Transcript_29361/m.77124 type:complete len:99 (-) Transcript_29361:858-1154(-)
MEQLSGLSEVFSNLCSDERCRQAGVEAALKDDVPREDRGAQSWTKDKVSPGYFYFNAEDRFRQFESSAFSSKPLIQKKCKRLWKVYTRSCSPWWRLFA